MYISRLKSVWTKIRMCKNDTILLTDLVDILNRNRKIHKWNMSIQRNVKKRGDFYCKTYHLYFFFCCCCCHFPTYSFHLLFTSPTASKGTLKCLPVCLNLKWFTDFLSVLASDTCAYNTLTHMHSCIDRLCFFCALAHSNGNFGYMPSNQHSTRISMHLTCWMKHKKKKKKKIFRLTAHMTMSFSNSFSHSRFIYKTKRTQCVA